MRKDKPNYRQSRRRLTRERHASNCLELVASADSPPGSRHWPKGAPNAWLRGPRRACDAGDHHGQQRDRHTLWRHRRHFGKRIVQRQEHRGCRHDCLLRPWPRAQNIALTNQTPFLDLNGISYFNITTPITIDGGGGITISGPLIGNGRLFNVNNSLANLTLLNTTISGFNAVGFNGGAIYLAAGTLNVDTVTLAGNMAGSGGGLWASGGSFSSTNLTFNGNVASGNGGGYALSGAGISGFSPCLHQQPRHRLWRRLVRERRRIQLRLRRKIQPGKNTAANGGLVAIDGGSVTIVVRTLSGNNATTGGALAVGPNNPATVTLNEGLTVRNNDATGQGAASPYSTAARSIAPPMPYSAMANAADFRQHRGRRRRHLLRQAGRNHAPARHHRQQLGHHIPGSGIRLDSNPGSITIADSIDLVQYRKRRRPLRQPRPRRGDSHHIPPLRSTVALACSRPAPRPSSPATISSPATAGSITSGAVASQGTNLFRQ